MWFCMPDGLREVVLTFKFRQNRLNGFRDLGGRNLPFPILKASGLYNSLYACTTVQAVIQARPLVQAGDLILSVLIEAGPQTEAGH